MRIAVLGSRGFPSTYSGYETFIRHFVPRAIAAGHEVIVYCRWREGGASRWQTQGAECRHTRGFESKSLSTLSFGLTSTWDARRSGADAALVVNCASGFWLPLLRRAGIASVVNVDGLEWERGKWNRLARAMFRTGARLSARYGDELVANSAAIAEIWAEQFGVRPHFIPYGAPVLESDDDALVAELGLPPGGYGLTVARLVPENNVELTLDALEAMGADRPPWVMVGSAVGWGEIEDRLRALDRRPDFRWLGHVSDQRLLDQLWRHCGVLVHGHSVGGTNPSLLQAMGAGAPVVAFDTPFSREVLGSGARLYSDLPTLVDEVGAVLGSAQTRAELARAGRERVASAYTWDGVCDDYLALLAEAGD